MAAIDIPATFQLRALRDGLEIAAPRVIESEVDRGPPKRRRASAAEACPVSAAFILTRSEHAAFSTWYDDTLAGGSAWFNWTHPITGAAVEAQFAGERAIKTTVIAGGRIKISCQMRIRTP